MDDLATTLIMRKDLAVSYRKKNGGVGKVYLRGRDSGDATLVEIEQLPELIAALQQIEKDNA